MKTVEIELFYEVDRGSEIIIHFNILYRIDFGNTSKLNIYFSTPDPYLHII